MFVTELNYKHRFAYACINFLRSLIELKVRERTQCHGKLFFAADARV